MNLSAASVLEALTAVDGTVVVGLEGELAGGAALGADRIVHLAGRGVAAGSGLACVTAGLAALGLVGEALFGVEFLLAGSENKFLSAFLTGESFVSVHEIPLQS